MKPTIALLFGICVVLVASAKDAQAQMSMGTFQGLLTGHVGAVTGGDVTNERMAVGASVAVHEASGWGAEIDFGRSTDVSAPGQLLDLTSYFVNAAWMKPRGTVRPFGLAGAGIMQVDGCVLPCGIDPRTYEFGVSLGGGTFVTLTDYVALRADARYFRSLDDHLELGRPANLAFWRLSVGATFTWVIVP
jgi:hypothetical protein